MRLATRLLLLVMLLPGPGVAMEPALHDENTRLATLFEQDQDDRRGFPDTKLSYVEINRRDAERRTAVIEMLKRTEIRAAVDYFRAAVIFHHGQTIEHYRMATSLAWIAHELEPDNTTYRWQTASCWDRMMLKRGKPQWYGSQSQRGTDGASTLSPIDEAVVSDDERARYNVKPLEDLKRKPADASIVPVR